MGPGRAQRRVAGEGVGHRRWGERGGASPSGVLCLSLILGGYGAQRGFKPGSDIIKQCSEGSLLCLMHLLVRPIVHTKRLLWIPV